MQPSSSAAFIDAHQTLFTSTGLAGDAGAGSAIAPARAAASRPFLLARARASASARFLASFSTFPLPEAWQGVFRLSKFDLRVSVPLYGCLDGGGLAALQARPDSQKLRPAALSTPTLRWATASSSSVMDTQDGISKGHQARDEKTLWPPELVFGPDAHGQPSVNVSCSGPGTYGRDHF